MGSPVAADGRTPPAGMPARFDAGAATAGAIEQTELPPLDGHGAPAAADTPASSDTSATAAKLEQLFTGLELPARSPALADLFRRKMTSPGSGSTGALLAVRTEALYRIGALNEAALLLASPASDPVLQALSARHFLAQGRTGEACAAIRQASTALGRLPPRIASETVATQGYCAAAGGAPQEAGLFAGLAREGEGASPVTLALLEAIASGTVAVLPDTRRLTALDYRLIRLNADAATADLAPRAEPAMLVAMATDQTLDPASRVSAAELAAASSIVPPATLSAAWRDAPLPASADAIDPNLRRANLFRAAESERTPARKARLIRSLLDEARRSGPYHATMPLLGPTVETLAPVAEIGWFAETAVEILAGAGRFDRARNWIRFAGTLDPRTDLTHWLALIDIAEATTSVRRGESLASVEELALRGRFPPDALHRLAAVLDALDYNVPMRLWEAASRTPQPNQGHLPETGVLANLQAASRQRDGLATTALAIRSTGTGTADQSNILVLGDVIRALRRAGFEAEARRFAYEALVPLWPRATSSG